MRERDTRVGRDIQRRGDARDDLEGYARFGERLGLFPTPAEDKRVAAFESHYRETAPRALDQHGADLILGNGVGGLLLADVDALRGERREVEKRFGGEMVVEDGVGLGENAAAFQGEQ